MRRTSGLRFKLIAILSAILLVGFAVLVYVTATSTSRIAGGLVKDISLEMAQKEGSRLESLLDRGEMAAQNTAAAMAPLAKISPTLVVATLQSYLDTLEDFGGVWAVFEPGISAKGAPAAALGADKRLAPYWNRFSGTKRLEPCVDYADPGDNGLYYRVPFTTSKVYVTKPTSYEIGGKQQTVVSFCAPIIVDGVTIGVAGLDFSLASFTERVLAIKPFGRSYAYLTDESGNILVHPEAKFVGTNIRDYTKENIEDKLALIKDGKSFEESKVSPATGKTSYYVYVPLSLGASGRNWSLCLVSPLSDILAPSRSLTVVMVGLVSATFLGFLVVLFLLVGALLKPLSVAVKGFRDLSQGEADLRHRITVNRKDEIGGLVADFNTFMEGLQNIVGNLKAAQEELRGVGSDLGGAAVKTALSVKNIRGRVDEVIARTDKQSASVAQSSSAVEQIARNIESLENLIADQAASVTEASASIEEMVGNIGSVTGSMEKLALRFSSLKEASEVGKAKQEEASERVSDITERSQTLMEANEAIAAIAKQTNLLAMNAAIEAAHAGEAGKGFSVVADEIRRLSETASEQSRGIGQELSSVGEAIAAMVAASRSSEESFGLVVTQIGENDNLVREMKAAMQEQKEGSVQILEALRAMNEITTQVRSASTEMSAGTETILSEMGQLRASTGEIKESVESMAAGTGEISENVESIAQSAEVTQGTIARMDEAIGRFKT